MSRCTLPARQSAWVRSSFLLASWRDERAVVGDASGLDRRRDHRVGPRVGPELERSGCLVAGYLGDLHELASARSRHPAVPLVDLLIDLSADGPLDPDLDQFREVFFEELDHPVVFERGRVDELLKV